MIVPRLVRPDWKVSRGKFCWMLLLRIGRIDFGMMLGWHVVVVVVVIVLVLQMGAGLLVFVVFALLEGCWVETLALS